jgi:hypothetical protein
MKRKLSWALVVCLALLVAITLAAAPAGASTKSGFETTKYYLGQEGGTFWTSGLNDEYFHVRDLVEVFADVSTDKRLTGLTYLTLNADFYWPVQDDPEVHSEGLVRASGKTVVGAWGFPLDEVNIQAWWDTFEDPYSPDWKSFVKDYFKPARPAAAWTSSAVAWEPADQSRPVISYWSGCGVKGSVTGLRFTSSAFAPQNLFTNWIFYEKGLVW